MSNIKSFYIKTSTNKNGYYSDYRINSDAFNEGKRYFIVKKYLDKLDKINFLIEVGGAGGRYLAYLEKNYLINKILYLDIFVDKKLKKNKRIKTLEINFEDNLPIQKGSVDAIILMMVIEHLFDPFEAFKKIHFLLSKEGIAFINLPLVTNIKNRIRLLFGFLPETSVPYARWLKSKESDGGHLYYFSIKFIEDLCSMANLKIIDYQYCGRFLFLKKLWPSLFASEISFAVKRK